MPLTGSGINEAQMSLTSSTYQLKVTEIIRINMKTCRQICEYAAQIHTDQYFLYHQFKFVQHYLDRTKYAEQTQMAQINKSY